MRTLAEIVRLRTSACAEAVDAVGMMAAGEPVEDGAAAAHVRSCLRCQAEVAAYRRVLVTMRSMRDDLLAPPPGSLEGALGLLGGPGLAGGTGVDEGAPAWALRAAYVGGITAASAAGVLVWFGRRRLGLAHAG